MKIFHSPASPFVRKCMVVAHELGIADRIEKLPSAAGPVKRDATILPKNPLGQVPTFLCDDGQVLYDSRVICEYLDAKHSGSLFPADGTQRWARLTELALADGMTAAALLARYETMLRPEALRWNDWTEGQLAKVRTGLEWLETAAPSFGDRVDIGTIAFGCTLGYMDFRFPSVDWRGEAPNTAKWFEVFNQRASMQATLPAVA
ncbi:glutathione S-transferase [Variovorax boronicumulans]|uniref:Glutathione S-transferase domain n=1 Tax=Variovorax paradoxus (strain EPS) TaxID=595537 RepID=E6V3A8_VARPE|nr:MULTISPECIES: glutathione S-transferase [Variovorax]ADU34598.1 Glutathione S-transferase domain [Variovorax paradoxus EPS]MDQ0033946.1 glutathione S-transferase [Variovorax boronicumulans]